LANEVQKNNQSIVNLGSGNVGGQTAANTRVM
jgi:hypothetical protein